MCSNRRKRREAGVGMADILFVCVIGSELSARAQEDPPGYQAGQPTHEHQVLITASIIHIVLMIVDKSCLVITYMYIVYTLYIVQACAALLPCPDSPVVCVPVCSIGVL